MTIKEQIYSFGNELDKLVERYRSEFDLPYGAVVGTLTVKATLLTLESVEDQDDEGDTP